MGHIESSQQQGQLRIRGVSKQFRVSGEALRVLDSVDLRDPSRLIAT